MIYIITTDTCAFTGSLILNRRVCFFVWFLFYIFVLLNKRLERIFNFLIPGDH